MTDTTAAGQIALDDFRAALLVNFDEAFTKVSSFFLDEGTSMFETLATISAEEASQPVGGGCANIAAQVNHTWFYLDMMNRIGRGEEVGKLDWDGSWDVGAVDDAEWQRLVDQLRAAHDEVRTFIQTFEGWNEEFISGAVGMVAHCAYHLGEIRAGLCTVKGNRTDAA